MTLPLMHAGYDVQWSAPPPGMESLSTIGDPDSPLTENLSSILSRTKARDPFTRNALLMQAGLDWLRTHPEKLPDLLVTKFLTHWSIDIAPRENPRPGDSFALDEQGQLIILQADQPLQDIGVIAAYSDSVLDRVGRPIHILYFGGLLGLAIAGVIFSYRQWRDVSLLWAVQISMTLNYVIFHPSTRYRVPSDPLLFLFSAYTLLWAYHRWRRRLPHRVRRTPTAFVPTPPPWIDSTS